MDKYCKERLEYLQKLEAVAINELDTLPVGSIERSLQWNWIRELNNRKSELEFAINFLKLNVAP